MRAIYFSIVREFKLILRNGISLYMAVAPALLAIIFIVIFGAVQNVSLTFAADTSANENQIKKLERIANIEKFDSIKGLKARVESSDNIPGITVENENVKLLFEGNEGDEFIHSVKVLVGLALAGDEISYKAVSVSPKGSIAYDVTMISVLLLSLFIGGATIGLSIVSERESGTIKAFAISPMRIWGYIATKLIPAFLLCAAGITAATAIMGKSYGLWSFLLLSLCSTLVSGMMIFIIGAFAKNQIAAIGVLKLLMPLSMILPVSAMFVPEKWQFLYYIFPMYWQYIAIDAITNSAAVFFPCILTLLTSIPWFISAVLIFAKKTELRVWR